MTAFTHTGSVARPSRPRSLEAGSLSVLHIVAPGTAGGHERVAQSLCLGFHRREHAVDVAVVTHEPDASDRFEAPLAAAGVRVHRLRFPPRAYFQEHQALWRLARELAPDVVHTHGDRRDWLGAWAARRAGIPTVTTVHALAGGTWQHLVSRQVERFTLARFDAVAAVSRPLADRLARLGIAPQRIHFIPSAWFAPEVPLGRAAARRALGLAASQQVIGWVGRLTPDHGLDLAIRALALLADLPVTLAVVGDGSERAALERLASRLDVAGRVHWCGGVPDVGRLFAAFDLFLLSSRQEGTPIVLFEAMAARTPIVAAAVGDVPDVLPRGTAVLAPPESPEALADGVRSVFDNPRHATARATAARTRLLTEYDPQRWLDAYEGLYRRVSRGTQAPSG